MVKEKSSSKLSSGILKLITPESVIFPNKADVVAKKNCTFSATTSTPELSKSNQNEISSAIWHINGYHETTGLALVNTYILRFHLRTSIHKAESYIMLEDSWMFRGENFGKLRTTESRCIS